MCTLTEREKQKQTKRKKRKKRKKERAINRESTRVLIAIEHS